LTLQFRNVAQVVQGERITRIEKIGPVKEPFGFFVLVLHESPDPLTI
jgi:hypothetical protein